MEKIKLSWNSQTPEYLIKNDENFKNILEFIKGGKAEGGQWIINFFGYDNEESLALLEKIKNMLEKEIIDKNFLWKEAGIRFFSQESQSSPDDDSLLELKSSDELLPELEQIPGQQSGVVMLYEPIDYGYKISKHKGLKYNIHGKIAGIFKKNKFFLLLFGNIPYDIHHFEENSPLSEFVWREYEIKEYGENELEVLNTLKSHLDNTILGYTNGNFQLVAGLENFWKEIKLADRVNELLNNFLQVPLKTKIEKMVHEKLAALSGFLENNQDKIGEKIKYIDNKKITFAKEKSSELFKDYFDKTALFDCNEANDDSQQLSTIYELTPKDVFEKAIYDSNFINNEGKIKSIPKISKSISNEFDQIAELFRFKKAIFILGAGNSLVSGAPDRKRMFVDILAQISSDEDGKKKFEEMDYDQLNKEFQDLINEFPQDDMRKRVIELLLDLKPSIGHFLLTQLVKSTKVKIKAFITTNFDTLLEDSLMDYGIRSKDFIKLVSREDIKADEWKWVNEFPNHLKIFKICGDMYYGSWLAVDDDAANNWIEKAVEAMANVNDFEDSHFIIILGQKFEEIDLSKIFDKKSKVNLIVVYANPAETDCREFEKRYKHKCKSLKTVHGDFGKFDNFMQELCWRLKKKNLL